MFKTIATTIAAAALVLAVAAPAQALITGNALDSNALDSNSLTTNSLTTNALTQNALTDNALTDNSLQASPIAAGGGSLSSRVVAIEFAAPVQAE